MNGTHRFFSAMTLALIASAAPLRAEDWPQWRGANRDAKVTGFTPPATWPKTLTPQWKVEVGLGDATPALVGDRLYVFARQGGDEVTLCLNAADGKEIWRDKYEAVQVTGPAGRHSGPRSSPAVADGKVVTVGVGGVFSCLNAADGKVLWRKSDMTAVPQFFTSSSPIIVDGMAIAHLGGRGQGAILALDLASGEQKWKWDGDAPAYCSPVVMTADGVKQIVEETERFVVGISAADGKLLWQLPFTTARMAYNAPTPTVDGQTVIFTGGNRGTHAVRVEKQGDTFAAKELWANPQIACQFASPVLKDGYLYGLSDKGLLFCLDAKDGKTAWVDTNRLSQFGAVVDAGPVILVLAESSDLLVLKPNPKALEQVARIKVSTGQTYSYPVLSGNRMYIKDQQSLMLYPLQ